MLPLFGLPFWIVLLFLSVARSFRSKERYNRNQLKNFDSPFRYAAKISNEKSWALRISKISQAHVAVVVKYSPGRGRVEWCRKIGIRWRIKKDMLESASHSSSWPRTRTLEFCRWTSHRRVNCYTNKGSAWIQWATCFARPALERAFDVSVTVGCIQGFIGHGRSWSRRTQLWCRAFVYN